MDVLDGEVLHRARVVDFEDGTFEIQQGTEMALTEPEDSGDDQKKDSAEEVPVVQAPEVPEVAPEEVTGEVAPEVPEVAAPRASRRGKAKKVAK